MPPQEVPGADKPRAPCGAKAEAHCSPDVVLAFHSLALGCSMADTLSSASQKHANFWFNDGNIVFQVRTALLSSEHRVTGRVQFGNQLFKLHRSLLSKASTVFSDMFSMPKPEDSDEGSEQHPITLPETSAEEFRIMVGVMYSSS